MSPLKNHDHQWLKWAERAGTEFRDQKIVTLRSWAPNVRSPCRKPGTLFQG